MREKIIFFGLGISLIGATFILIGKIFILFPFWALILWIIGVLIVIKNEKIAGWIERNDLRL